MSSERLQRKIGLSGAVFLMVGNVVGASIFILPGELAGSAGPAVFVAYLIALIPAFFNSVVAAQVGGILPVSAADYVFTSIVLHPVLGFLSVWITLLGALVGGPLLAYGFAEYFAFFMPDLSPILIAYAVIVFVTCLNLLGLRSSVKIQMLMVAGFVSTLLVLAIGGLFYIDTSLLAPLAPNGWNAVIAAAVPAYFSYTGLVMLMSISEEIENPARNIPLTIFYTLVLVALIYTLVSFVTPGLLPWQELGSLAAPLSAAAATFLPGWYSTAITLAALLAAVTSVNMIVIICSRAIFAVARTRVFPEAISRISPRTGEPTNAILLIAALIGIGIALQGNIAQYASVAVIGWMLYGIFWGLALVRLPKKLPEHYNNARFKLSTKALWVTAIVNIVVGLIFIGVGVSGNLLPSLAYLILLILGAMYYLWRQRRLAEEGISLEELLMNETREARQATRQ